MKFHKNKLLNSSKIYSIIILTLTAIASVVFLIYFLVYKKDEDVFSAEHISWTDWLNKERIHQGTYKLFIISPSESKIYVTAKGIKFIIDAHSTSLNSALLADPTTGMHKLALFNHLLNLNGEHLKPGVYTMPKTNNQWLLPASLMVTALISTIIATGIYFKGRAFKLKDILKKIGIYKDMK